MPTSIAAVKRMVGAARICGGNRGQRDERRYIQIALAMLTVLFCMEEFVHKKAVEVK